MPKLDISLLGPLAVAEDHEPATGFDSDKVRALLAYLATEADRPHRNQSLATLLWPDLPEREADEKLHGVLANLRSVILDAKADPSHLTITKETIQLNLDSEVQVDVQTLEFEIGKVDLSDKGVEDLDRALRLYRGEFMEGFAIPDSSPFEEWMMQVREHLRREVLDAHQKLAAHYDQEADFERALDHAQRQLEIEPWLEEAHRQAMRALALSGQHGAALAQYETAKSALMDELEVDPATETTALYEQIRDGTLAPRKPTSAIRGYELKEQIGEGAFGVIYRAHQSAVDREVAIKVIQPEFASRPEFIRRFEKEAQLVARLEHPSHRAAVRLLARSTRRIPCDALDPVGKSKGCSQARALEGGGCGALG